MPLEPTVYMYTSGCFSVSLLSSSIYPPARSLKQNVGIQLSTRIGIFTILLLVWTGLRFLNPKCALLIPSFLRSPLLVRPPHNPPIRELLGTVFFISDLLREMRALQRPPPIPLCLLWFHQVQLCPTTMMKFGSLCGLGPHQLRETTMPTCTTRYSTGPQIKSHST